LTQRGREGGEEKKGRIRNKRAIPPTSRRGEEKEGGVVEGRRRQKKKSVCEKKKKPLCLTALPLGDGKKKKALRNSQVWKKTRQNQGKKEENG